VYSGVVNGQTTTFGTSGLLYRSNKVMYDRATRSLWNQFSGEPIIGTLADSGIRQPFFPSVVSTWGEWLEEHPDTTVLSRETDIYPPEFYVPEDDPRAIYYSYFTSDEVMFPVWLRDPVFEPKEVVVGITIQSASKAWRVADLQDVRLVNDTVGGVDIVIVASPDSRSGRVYERAGARFSTADNGEVSGPPSILADSTGSRWNVTEQALVNADDPGIKLLRIPTTTSFWFGWYQYHPETEIFEPPG
jgi:hypothetical protein